MLPVEGERIRAGGRLPDNDHVVLLFDHPRQTITHDGVVIRDQDPNLAPACLHGILIRVRNLSSAILMQLTSVGAS